MKVGSKVSHSVVAKDTKWVDPLAALSEPLLVARTVALWVDSKVVRSESPWVALWVDSKVGSKVARTVVEKAAQLVGRKVEWKGGLLVFCSAGAMAATTAESKVD